MPRELEPSDEDIPGGWLQQAGHYIEQRRLASSVGTFDQMNPRTERARCIINDTCISVSLTNTPQLDARHDDLVANISKNGASKAK
jgi:hypothetical protein